MGILEVLTALGRFIEYQLVGQSSFQLGDAHPGVRTVQTELEGKLQLEPVQNKLKEDFGLSLHWPILLEIKTPPPLGWKAGFYHSEGNLGRYEPQGLGRHQGHHIMIRPGLPLPAFQAVLAHELIHAVQTERKLLIDNQALREGMARWVEYHFLKTSDSVRAQRLRQLRHYTFGKAIETILEYEANHGRLETLRWLETISTFKQPTNQTDQAVAGH